MTDTDIDRLRRVADKQGIHDVIMRFSRGVDRCDEALLRSCFHPDATDNHGHFKGNGWEFATFIVKSIAERAHHTTHSVANVLIELDDDDEDLARAESYVLAYLRRTDDDGREWLDFFSGRYIDRFERRDGAWRIASRVVVQTGRPRPNSAPTASLCRWTPSSKGSEGVMIWCMGGGRPPYSAAIGDADTGEGWWMARSKVRS